MDEIQINSATGEEAIGDDFYEKIEAPKFVDLTAPDRCRIQNDDRYWFCLRVGCDQKHEEEMDSEAIYKNFVLRVMAARSPSVRLRKTLCRKDTCSNLQCPRTVPAKSSKSRVSRLAMISSISMGEAKVKRNANTPNVKAVKLPSSKALTTPRNKKGISNPATFRSVRNPNLTTIEVPKSRVLAKALVFHSPKKAVKLKKSVELGSSLRKICAGMKKLEIMDANKKNALGCDKPSKRLRGREVKSRVYDSLKPQNQKNGDVKTLKCLKEKNKEKDLQLSKGPMYHERNENEYADKEIDLKQQDGSLEICSTSCTLSNSEGMNSRGNEIPQSKNGSHDEIPDRSSCEENIEPCSTEMEILKGVESEGKENAMASHPEESDSKDLEIDDKENTAASDENRNLNTAMGKLVKKDVFGKHENSKSIQKVTKVMSKTLKENPTSAVNSTQGMKYRKPKPTNPKPFRLRTDERGILKEANLEKKHLQPSLNKATTVPGSQAGSSCRRHQNVLRNEKSLGQNETDDTAHEGNDIESLTRILKDQPQTSSSRIPKGSTERKLSTVPQKRTGSEHQKTKFPSSLGNSQAKAAQKSGGRMEKAKPAVKQLVRPAGVSPIRKKMVPIMKHGQLGMIKKVPRTMSRPKEASEHNKSRAPLATSASNASRPSPYRRRHTTIPKEPSFHSIHVPRSCTKKSFI